MQRAPTRPLVRFNVLPSTRSNRRGKGVVMLALMLIGGFALFVIDLLTGRRLSKMDSGELFGALFLGTMFLWWLGK